ncbi:synaptogyrin-1 [Nephila pilipes]|uniref:Synaptogyrin n=1 Tax=Nephila pilipes TaxID=299642 RepID=A0A8X6QEB7_NEPPI|nr:synaptogyrin-1 [Nephila pilipes]
MNGGVGSIYGAGKAGSGTDPISIITKPYVIVRILCWVFSIVVFGCIGSEGWMKNKCLYNNDINACNFGTGIGVIAFLGSLALLITDVMFNNISSIKVRRRAVIADMAFSAVMSFMWFVTFCYLSDSWRKAPYPKDGYGVNNLRGAIAFSFFSIFVWAACIFFAFQRYKQGADTAFMTSGFEGDGSMPGGAPYTSYPDGPEMNEGYQEPPFSATQKDMAPGGPGFQQPAY